MISINKGQIRSQQLQKPFMPQNKQPHKRDSASSNLAHTKLIHKKKRQPLLGYKKKQEDHYPRHLPKDIVSKARVKIEQGHEDSPKYWLKIAKDWYLDPEEQAKTCIETETEKLPILASIQDLFSFSSSGRLTNEIDVDCFYRYCRTVSYLQSNDRASITLAGDKASAVGHIGIDRQGSHVVNSIMLTSSEQLQAIQKRASFMEKLKENQSKYDTSIGRMSEISKELAFNYRIYLQKRSQLLDSFNLLSAKIPLESQKQQFAYDQYTRLLIRKNLQQAFLRIEVDPLNYFKFKEHCQLSRTDSYRHILNTDELRIFIDRRRPKRGRKMHLATACSVCLSDYHQMSNPFNACGVCGLRAHKICFSFENSKCGYCAYQKVERHLKEQTTFCIICKQQGLMTIKLGEKEFAHAFCLLVHGFWRLRGQGKHGEEDLSLFAGTGRISRQGFLQSKFRKFCSNQIEFLNPNKNCTAVSLPAIDSTIDALHQIEQEQIQSENDSSLGGIGIIRDKYSAWQNQQSNSRSICKCCQQGFYKNCSISCDRCQQQYHILCAYLSGFDLKICDNARSSGIESSISINCCCERKNEVAWSRKYRLNYQRIAYNTEETIKTADRDLMQNEKECLFFSI